MLSYLLPCVIFAIFPLVISEVLYEAVKSPDLQPRTFYLSPRQEFEVITQVLCKGYPCPEYSVVKDLPHYIQQRSYRESKFMRVTSSRPCNLSVILEEGKERINNYLSGENEREEKYEKTFPLLIHAKHNLNSFSKNPWCRMSYTVNLFIPHYWGLISKPTEIYSAYRNFTENLQIYVHTFSGNVEDLLFIAIDTFRRNLDDLGKCYQKMDFYIAIYDFPRNALDSRNELWFLKCPKK